MGDIFIIIFKKYIIHYLQVYHLVQRKKQVLSIITINELNKKIQLHENKLLFSVT